MTKRYFIALAGFVAASAAGAQAPAPQEASIAFANSGGIAEWQARDERAIYLMDRSGKWFLARFQGQCYRLPLENSIGFDTGLSGNFDRFSAVVTEYGRCPVDSVVRTDRPAEVGLTGVASASR